MNISSATIEQWDTETILNRINSLVIIETCIRNKMDLNGQLDALDMQDKVKHPSVLRNQALGAFLDM